MSCASMRAARADHRRRDTPSSACSKLAGWSALTRARTSASGSVGVDLAGGRAGRRALSGQLLVADRQDLVGRQAVECPRARRARRSARGRARQSSTAVASVLAAGRSRTRRRRPWPARPRRAQPALRRPSGRSAAGRDDLVEERRASPRPTRARAPATAGPGARSSPGPMLGQEAGDRLEPAGDRREALVERRESRANRPKSGSPMPSIAVERRSHRRWPSRSNSSSRRLWISMSRSKRTSADSARPGRAPRSAQAGRGPGRPGPRIASRRAIGQAVVLGVDAQERRRVRVGADRAPEVLLDEVVEPLDRGDPRLRPAPVGGRAGTPRGARVRRRPGRRGPAGHLVEDVAGRRPMIVVDVGGADVVVGGGADGAVGILDHQDARAP